jgi:AraC-like DNA-binding protein
MVITFDERIPDSPYIESISHGITTAAGELIRPAENSWHMVVVRDWGKPKLFLVGPLTTSGIATFGEGGEVIWIRFRLGAFMPHVRFQEVLDIETLLPEAASKSFWLKGSAWQFPTYENVDTFIEQLVRQEILVHDPLVSAVMQDHPHDLSPRTVRHRFLQSTGVTQNHIRQVERARQAAALLSNGLSILDTVHELGYFDQPHLTKSLKQWVGYTPAQLLQISKTCHFIQDESLSPPYNEAIGANTNALVEIW